jgi:hypothetical protein
VFDFFFFVLVREIQVSHSPMDRKQVHATCDPSEVCIRRKKQTHYHQRCHATLRVRNTEIGIRNYWVQPAGTLRRNALRKTEAWDLQSNILGLNNGRPAPAREHVPYTSNDDVVQSYALPVAHPANELSARRAPRPTIPSLDVQRAKRTIAQRHRYLCRGRVLGPERVFRCWGQECWIAGPMLPSFGVHSAWVFRLVAPSSFLFRFPYSVPAKLHGIFGDNGFVSFFWCTPHLDRKLRGLVFYPLVSVRLEFHEKGQKKKKQTKKQKNTR